jgi:CBS domain-containing protein
MTVEKILKGKGDDVFAVRPDHTIAEAAQLLTNRRIGAAMVCEGGTCVGVLSERDIVLALAKHKGNALTMSVKSLMSSPVVTCKPRDKVKDIMSVMTERRIRHVPVIVEDDLVGMVSIGDVIKHRLAEKQLEAAILREFAGVAAQ